MEINEEMYTFLREYQPESNKCYKEKLVGNNSCIKE